MSRKSTGESTTEKTLRSFNDVMFSGHAMVLTSVTLWQIFHYWDYPPLQRKESLFRAAVVSSCVLYSVTVGVCLFLVISTGEKLLSWYGLMSILSEAKLVISICKYVPQVMLNWSRKSTSGWNVDNVLLDFSGGLLSVAQLCIDAWNSSLAEGGASALSIIFGDPVKLFLGTLSIFFDIVFMLQHYVWYKEESDSAEDVEGAEYSMLR